MAITSFLQNVWSAQILRRLEVQSVCAQLANRNYEGDAATAKTVNITALTSAVTVSDYTRGTKVDLQTDLNDAGQVLNVDQEKAFNVYVDNLDEAQSNANIMGEVSRKAAIGVDAVVDQFCLDTISQGVPAANIIEVTTARGMVDDGYTPQVLEALEKVREANIPSDVRPWMLVNPRFLNKLDAWALENPRAAGIYVRPEAEGGRPGYRGQLFDFDMFMTNRTPSGMAGTTANLVANRDNLVIGTTDAWTLARAISSLRAYQPEGMAGDALFGLYVYGGKVTDPSQLFMLQVENRATV